jgi:hypothetical protein
VTDQRFFTNDEMIKVLRERDAAVAKVERLEGIEQRLISAIRDIDQHATPSGFNVEDPDDSPKAYIVSAGSLHRALGAASGQATVGGDHHARVIAERDAAVADKANLAIVLNAARRDAVAMDRKLVAIRAAYHSDKPDDEILETIAELLYEPQPEQHAKPWTAAEQDEFWNSQP